MSSDKQIAANRRNAKKSTGPVTPEGKAAVRFNALRHGLYARTAILPGENSDQFEQLCDELEADWQPETATEKILLEQMAVSHWSLVRLGRASAALCPEDEPLTEKLPLLVRLDQHTARLQRSFHRALKELRSLQHARRQALQEDQNEQDDPEGKPLKFVQGIEWLDENGNQTMVVPPAVLGPDGRYHDVTPEVWDKLQESG